MDNVVTGYYGNKICPSVSGYIKQGSMIAIVGPNGIGKSTLLKTLAGFLPIISGKLEFGKLGCPSIGYLPQIRKLDCHYPLTVFDVVSMGFWPKISVFKGLNYYHQIAICRALKKVKLLNLLHQYIKNLSGGQFQRMLFARILVQKASLILLDEPFQGVDMNICNIMMYSMYQLCQNGCTIIVVLHDDRLINKNFSNVLVLTRSCSFWKFSLL